MKSQLRRETIKNVTCCFQLTVMGTKKNPKNLATNRSFIRAGSRFGGISGRKPGKSVFKEAKKERNRTQCIYATSSKVFLFCFLMK